MSTGLYIGPRPAGAPGFASAFLEHLHRADGHCRGQGLEPIRSLKRAQQLDERIDARALPGLEMLEGVERYSRAGGQGLLVEVLEQPQLAQPGSQELLQFVARSIDLHL